MTEITKNGGAEDSQQRAYWSLSRLFAAKHGMQLLGPPGALPEEAAISGKARVQRWTVRRPGR